MSIKLHELEYECQKRNIVTDTRTKYRTYDYLDMIGKDVLIDKYGSLIETPFPIKYRFSLKSPMLSKNFKDLKLAEQQDILNNPNKNWIAEHKYNGCRSIVIYDPESGFHFFGRDISPVDFLPVEYTDKIVFIKNGRISYPESYKGIFNKPFVLDVEIKICHGSNVDGFYSPISVESVNRNSGQQNNAETTLLSFDTETCHDLQMSDCPLEFIVLDFLYYNRDIKNQPLYKRKVSQEQLTNMLNQNLLPFVNSEVFTDNFEQVFNDYTNVGGEGLIFKNLNMSYHDSVNRKSDVQVKLKGNTLSKLKNDIIDYDVFISGYKISTKDKLVSSISCSVFLTNTDGTEDIEHEICNIVMIPREVRLLLTDHTLRGRAIFNTNYLGKVLSVNAKGINSTNLKFIDTICNQWDFNKDKNKFSCLVNEVDLINISNR